MEMLDFCFGAPGSAENGRQRAAWFKNDSVFDDGSEKRLKPFRE